MSQERGIAISTSTDAVEALFDRALVVEPELLLRVLGLIDNERWAWLVRIPEEDSAPAVENELL